MASNINFIDIDEEFPVPGQDNDSQGFRDNFALIRSNFQYTKTDIETLQTDTAKLNEGNNFQGNAVRNAVFLQNSEFVFPTADAITDEDLTISFSNGHYQTVSIAQNNLTLTLTGWAATGYMAKMRLAIQGSSPDPLTEFTFTWEASNSGNVLTVADNWPWNSVAGTNDDPLSTTVDSGAFPHIFDVWTIDGGQNVFVEYIGQFTL